MPTTRPNLPGTGNLPTTRPSPLPETRPNLPNLPTTRPSPLPGNPGVGTRPNLPETRPNLPTTRPTPLPETRPNLPGTGNLPTTRPTPLPETRPNLPNLPNLPTTRPTPLPGNPGVGTRPNLPGNGNLPNLPNTRPNYPGNGNLLQPGVLPNRPNIDINNRPSWTNNRPTINNNNFNNNNFNNNFINNNNFNVIAPTIYNPNRPWGGYTKPYYGGVYRPYGWANTGNNLMWGNYYVGRYHPWHCGYWHGFWNFPPTFIPRPIPFGWFLPLGVNVNYYNPYWATPPATTVVQYVNYSTPLPVQDEIEPAAPIDTPVPVPAAAPQEDANAKAASVLFDRARIQFKQGDPANAQKTVEEAIAKLPQDPTLHEFRALTLFAQGKYTDAAAAIYAVLAAGPGWNDDTLYALYPDKETYAKQLAMLQQFTTANPQNASAQFLLGYQYLTLGDKDKAAAAFTVASTLEPKDELSKQLAKSLTDPAP